MATFVLPSAAGAESIVPPGNSAATQYTEAFPTAGGEKQAGNTRRGQPLSPTKALGARNVHRLQEQGPAGRAVAEVAAETAPTPVAQAPAPSSESAGGHGHPTSGSEPQADRSPEATEEISAVRVDSSGGSSGLGEVLGQATGSSSPDGGLGVLLPLIVIGAIAWAALTFWRRKSQAD